MTEFDFSKGNNIKLKLNSEVLAGVSKIVCTQNNTYTVINQFLTDIPVYKIPKSTYSLTLTMNYKATNPFVFLDNFDSLKLEGKDTTVIYSNCCVKKIQSTVNAKGAIEDTVTIDAEMRYVHDGKYD